jgi:hypothetical protein
VLCTFLFLASMWRQKQQVTKYKFPVTFWGLCSSLSSLSSSSSSSYPIPMALAPSSFFTSSSYSYFTPVSRIGHFCAALDHFGFTSIPWLYSVPSFSETLFHNSFWDFIIGNFFCMSSQLYSLYAHVRYLVSVFYVAVFMYLSSLFLCYPCASNLWCSTCSLKDFPLKNTPSLTFI